MFDTHCHLSEPPFYRHLSDSLKIAQTAGVTRFLSISAGAEDWEKLSTIASVHSEITPAFGIHPLFIPAHHETALARLTQYVRRFPNALIGEIGLDFYHRPDPLQQKIQENLFWQQIMIARSENRPVVIHQRKAQDVCLRILRDTQFTRGGFAHGFSGSLEAAKQWMAAGFVMGIGTVLLREHSRLREVLRALPREAWVLESDAPFMCPNNHPAILARIVQTAATIRGESLDEIKTSTTQNALRILNG